MRTLALLVFSSLIIGSTSAMAYTPEPRAKLLMITSTNTQASSPDMEVVVNFTDFNSMSECANAVWLLTSPKTATTPINGTQVPGQVLPSKVGSYGNAITYTYRCIPFGYDNNGY